MVDNKTFNWFEGDEEVNPVIKEQFSMTDADIPDVLEQSVETSPKMTFDMPRSLNPDIVIPEWVQQTSPLNCAAALSGTLNNLIGDNNHGSTEDNVLAVMNSARREIGEPVLDITGTGGGINDKDIINYLKSQDLKVFQVTGVGKSNQDSADKEAIFLVEKAKELKAQAIIFTDRRHWQAIVEYDGEYKLADPFNGGLMDLTYDEFAGLVKKSVSYDSDRNTIRTAILVAKKEESEPV